MTVATPLAACACRPLSHLFEHRVRHCKATAGRLAATDVACREVEAAERKARHMDVLDFEQTDGIGDNAVNAATEAVDRQPMQLYNVGVLALTVIPSPLDTEMPAYTPAGATIDTDCVIVNGP